VAAPTIGGLLNVNKERGPTSHDVVDLARRALGTSRVGHAGTLDPAAHGVLPILFGRVTRLARFFLGYRKQYRFIAKLGAETSTGDDEGDVLYQRDVPGSAYDALGAVARSFVGEIAQEVPRFSAVKLDGEPLYRRARRGEAVSAPTRTVNVYRLEIEKVEPPTFTAFVESGGGMYVRALARDIGRKLGVGAYVVDLGRLAVGPFVLADALPQARLADAGLEGLLASPHFAPAAELLPEMAAANLSAAEVADVAYGRAVAASAGARVGEPLRLVAPDGGLVGVGEAASGGRVKPDAVLITPEELESR
jgi:tRNA pseudouridine55 synthase